jgi:hypothetical protein
MIRWVLTSGCWMLLTGSSIGHVALMGLPSSFASREPGIKEGGDMFARCQGQHSNVSSIRHLEAICKQMVFERHVSRQRLDMAARLSVPSTRFPDAGRFHRNKSGKLQSHLFPTSALPGRIPAVSPPLSPIADIKDGMDEFEWQTTYRRFKVDCS